MKALSRLRRSGQPSQYTTAAAKTKANRKNTSLTIVTELGPASGREVVALQSSPARRARGRRSSRCAYSCTVFSEVFTEHDTRPNGSSCDPELWQSALMGSEESEE